MAQDFWACATASKHSVERSTLRARRVAEPQSSPPCPSKARRAETAYTTSIGRGKGTKPKFEDKPDRDVADPTSQPACKASSRSILFRRETIPPQEVARRQYSGARLPRLGPTEGTSGSPARVFKECTWPTLALCSAALVSLSASGPVNLLTRGSRRPRTYRRRSGSRSRFFRPER